MLESAQAANPGFPTLLPAITAPAVDKMIDLSLLSPRVGVSYALDENGRTLVRASYGLFGAQLGTGTVQAFSAASQAMLIYSATDRNGNNVADPGELDALLDVRRRRSRQSRRGRQLQPRRSRSQVAEDPRIRGRPRPRIDAELRRQRLADVAAIQRRDLERPGPRAGQHRYPLVGVTRADYSPEGVVAGNVAGIGAYSQPYFAPRESSLPPGNGGEYRNRPGYTSSISASRCRRPSACRTGGWRASASRPTVTREYFDDPSAAMQDPTSTTWPNIDGGAFVTGTSGSGKSEIYLLLPRYQFTASGLYQLPCGHQRRRQSRRARGLRHAVLRDGRVGRSGVAGEARAAGRSGRQPAARRDVARPAGREVVHVRRPRAGR